MARDAPAPTPTPAPVPMVTATDPKRSLGAGLTAAVGPLPYSKEVVAERRAKYAAPSETLHTELDKVLEFAARQKDERYILSTIHALQCIIPKVNLIEWSEQNIAVGLDENNAFQLANKDKINKLVKQFGDANGKFHSKSKVVGPTAHTAAEICMLHRINHETGLCCARSIESTAGPNSQRVQATPRAAQKDAQQSHNQTGSVTAAAPGAASFQPQAVAAKQPQKQHQVQQSTVPSQSQAGASKSMPPTSSLPGAQHMLPPTLANKNTTPSPSSTHTSVAAGTGHIHTPSQAMGLGMQGAPFTPISDGLKRRRTEDDEDLIIVENPDHAKFKKAKKDHKPMLPSPDAPFAMSSLTPPESQPSASSTPATQGFIANNLSQPSASLNAMQPVFSDAPVLAQSMTGVPSAGAGPSQIVNTFSPYSQHNQIPVPNSLVSSKANSRNTAQTPSLSGALMNQQLGASGMVPKPAPGSGQTHLMTGTHHNFGPAAGNQYKPAQFTNTFAVLPTTSGQSTQAAHGGQSSMKSAGSPAMPSVAQIRQRGAQLQSAQQNIIAKIKQVESQPLDFQVKSGQLQALRQQAGAMQKELLKLQQLLIHQMKIQPSHCPQPLAQQAALQHAPQAPALTGVANMQPNAAHVQTGSVMPSSSTMQKPQIKPTAEQIRAWHVMNNQREQVKKQELEMQKQEDARRARIALAKSMAKANANAMPMAQYQGLSQAAATFSPANNQSSSLVSSQMSLNDAVQRGQALLTSAHWKPLGSPLPYQMEQGNQMMQLNPAMHQMNQAQTMQPMIAGHQNQAVQQEFGMHSPDFDMQLGFDMQQPHASQQAQMMQFSQDQAPTPTMQQAQPMEQVLSMHEGQTFDLLQATPQTMQDVSNQHQNHAVVVPKQKGAKAAVEHTVAPQSVGAQPRSKQTPKQTGPSAAVEHTAAPQPLGPHPNPVPTTTTVNTPQYAAFPYDEPQQESSTTIVQNNVTAAVEHTPAPPQNGPIAAALPSNAQALASQPPAVASGVVQKHADATIQQGSPNAAFEHTVAPQSGGSLANSTPMIAQSNTLQSLSPAPVAITPTPKPSHGAPSALDTPPDSSSESEEIGPLRVRTTDGKIATHNEFRLFKNGQVKDKQGRFLPVTTLIPRLHRWRLGRGQLGLHNKPFPHQKV